MLKQFLTVELRWFRKRHCSPESVSASTKSGSHVEEEARLSTCLDFSVPKSLPKVNMIDDGTYGSTCIQHNRLRWTRLSVVSMLQPSSVESLDMSRADYQYAAAGVAGSLKENRCTVLQLDEQSISQLETAVAALKELHEDFTASIACHLGAQPSDFTYLCTVLQLDEQSISQWKQQ